MKALGKENELSEELATPNEMSAMAIEKEMAEGIPDVNTDFSVDTDFSADLSENDDALDEILKEEKFTSMDCARGSIAVEVFLSYGEDKETNRLCSV